jgi:hypothetical protein
MDREDRMERSEPARVAAELAEFAKYLKGMTDDQLARHLADFLARRPAAASRFLGPCPSRFLGPATRRFVVHPEGALPLLLT